MFNASKGVMRAMSISFSLSRISSQTFNSIFLDLLVMPDAWILFISIKSHNQTPFPFHFLGAHDEAESPSHDQGK